MKKIKSVSAGQVKAGPDDGLGDGEFIVYPSTFTKEPDSYGDVIAQGAFVDSIETWKDSGDVMPGMYLHDPNQIVAEAIDMGEDEHGWWVKGKFDDDPEAQRIYKWLKGRRLSSLSFGYQTLEEGKVELPDGKSANELRKVHALEFSFLPKGFAANPDTSVVAVKRLAESVKQGVEMSDEQIESLREASSAIDSVLSEINDQDDDGDDDQEEASGKSGVNSDASDDEPVVKSPVSEDEQKSNPSVLNNLAAITDTYAVAYGNGEGEDSK